MRFGVCAGLEQAELLAAAGYDYIELPASSVLVPEAEEAIWEEKRRLIDALSLRPETFNLFVSGPKIVGPDVDTGRLARYVQNALTRAARVGGEIIVFGSAGARNVPEGFPRDEAQAQIHAFLRLCADVSDRTGVTVAIEPLWHGESNIINRVSEGAALAREIGRAGVRNLADTYHMEREEEPLSAIVDGKEQLAHVHTADTGRFAPGTGSYDHVALFRALREAGYDTRVSIECGWQNAFAEQIGPALHHLKAAYAAAQTD